jgi:hypothetical protein
MNYMEGTHSYIRLEIFLVLKVYKQFFYEYFSEMSYYIASKLFHIGIKSYVATVTSTTRTNTNPSMTCKICNPQHSTLGAFWKANNIRR